MYIRLKFILVLNPTSKKKRINVISNNVHCCSEGIQQEYFTTIKMLCMYFCNNHI